MPTGSVFYNTFHKEAIVQKRVITSDNFTYRLIINYIIESLNKKSNLKILDYGCGVGTLAFYFANIGNNIVGTDISTYSLQLAQQSANRIGISKAVKFISLNKFNQLKPHEKYDLIICSEVIEHVENDSIIINRLARFLKKKGLLFISTPSIHAPLYRLKMLKKFDKDVGHIRRYDKKNLLTVVHASKLEVIKISEKEGILRNLLFTNSTFGMVIRFLKGPLSTLITVVDDLSIKMLGGSNWFLLAQKV